MISVQDVTKQFSNGKGLFHITFDVKEEKYLVIYNRMVPGNQRRFVI